MVGWVRGCGWCASLLGLATLSASLSPQRQYLPPFNPVTSASPLCPVSTSTVTEHVTTVETQWITTTLSPSMQSSHFLGYPPPSPDACPITITVTSDTSEGPRHGGFVTPMPSRVTSYQPVTSHSIVVVPCRCDACSYVVRTDPCECAEEFGCGEEPLLFRETQNE
ncbi:uncharacterized protein LOC122244322 [Penaeus japonicus]|uniref:uncharacterized protein LOC122244322 n=1 Tax=Penaeus japonicus TaxID=27405 RepID=UPI001C712386|nr:uncharacterized protein LOC122244322 [Penaeus japonicus]